MIPRKHWYFTDGSTLEPSRMTENLRLLAEDVKDAADRRYVYSSFVLDFSALTNSDDPSEFKFEIPTLFYYDIVGVQLELYSDTNVTGATLTITGVSGAETTSVAGAGVSARAFSQNAFVAQVTGTATFTLSVSASSTPWTLTACRATIMIRADRGNTGVGSYSSWIPSNIAFPGKTTVLADVTNELTAGLSAADVNAEAQNRLRMEVFTRRNIAAGAMPSSDQDLQIPFSGRTLERIVVGLVAPATSSMRASLRSSSTEITGVSLTGTGLTSLATGTVNSQQVRPATSGSGANDDILRIARIAGTDAIPFCYLVAYWSA
jgi:hypothetical protein